VLSLLDDRLPRMNGHKDRLAMEPVLALFSDEDAAAMRLGAAARLRLYPRGYSTSVVTVTMPPALRIVLRAEVVSIGLTVGLVEVALALGWDVAFSGGILEVGRTGNGTAMVKHSPHVAPARSR
jgi:hypothetical protein